MVLDVSMTLTLLLFNWFENWTLSCLWIRWTLKRGACLREMTKSLTEYVFVLLEKTNCTQSYVFEGVEST